MTSKDQPPEIQPSLLSLLEQTQQCQDGIPYEGHPRDDQNIPGNVLIVHATGTIYSFNKSSILTSETLSQDRIRIWVRVGAPAFSTKGFRVGSDEAFTIGMEDIPPPLPTFDPQAPTAAAPPEPSREPLAATLAGAMAAWSGQCHGGDRYNNNCAHFLADAFIRAGFSELARSNPHINARCLAKRPIRAREMWLWFKSKATRTSREMVRNTGNWAVFQLDETAYWGGHVALFDSDAWQYYGTGWYPDWDQFLYQW